MFATFFDCFKVGLYVGVLLVYCIGLLFNYLLLVYVLGWQLVWVDCCIDFGLVCLLFGLLCSRFDLGGSVMMIICYF